MRNTYKVEDILDKGKDSILLVGVKSQDTRGRDMFYNQVLNVESTITNDVMYRRLHCFSREMVVGEDRGRLQAMLIWKRSPLDYLTLNQNTGEDW